MDDVPVTFPPGTDRLAATPSFSRSPLMTMTIGIVDVALLATSIAVAP
jgi:hypothetical protein